MWLVGVTQLAIKYILSLFTCVSGFCILLACAFAVATVGVSSPRKEICETCRKMSIFSMSIVVHIDDSKATANHTTKQVDQPKVEEDYFNTYL